MVSLWGVESFNSWSGSSEWVVFWFQYCGLGLLGLMVVLNLITRNVIMTFGQYCSPLI